LVAHIMAIMMADITMPQCYDLKKQLDLSIYIYIYLFQKLEPQTTYQTLNCYQRCMQGHSGLNFPNHVSILNGYKFPLDKIPLLLNF
jgi:hypothetical protein